VSTALAIAAATRVLSSVILQGIQSAESATPGLSGILGSAPAITSRAPDQLETGDSEAAQLSLFLYHVTYNQGWREVGLPSRNGSGAGVDRPPLALDLHYLLIAYGNSEYVPQILLGLGMQALHETPFLYRQQITNVFTPGPALNQIDTALATANLAGQIEMIKVTPEPLSVEDLSKLWTSFGGKFRPAAGYEATVVLIESTAPVQAALPVLNPPNLQVLQLRQPSIAAVSPLYLPWASSLSLTLTGTNLTGQGTVVVFDNNPTAPQTPQPPGPGGGGVSVTVPPLPAGLNTLRVVQQVAVGAPPPKNVVESNVSLFYLQPVIQQPPTTGAAASGVTPVTVQIEPAMQSTQQVQLLLNELAPPAGAVPLSFTFDADPAQIAANSVTFGTFGTRPGAYLVRVRVDGAESSLQTDSMTLDYSGPVVTL
jgi:Pvc16 N-terminal domain